MKNIRKRKSVSKYMAGMNEFSNATFQDCPENGDEEILDFVADPFAPNGIRFETDQFAVQNNLTNICKNYECNTQFNEQVIRNKCGKTASDLWVKLLKARVRSAIDIYNTFQVINGTLPECDSFLKN